MKSENELKYIIENLRYDIESVEMEKAGLMKRFDGLKEQMIPNAIILLLYLLFLKIMIWGGYDNGISFAFIVVLQPIFYALLIVYVVIFIFKPLKEIYINCNWERARKRAVKKGFKSISLKIDECDVRLAALHASLAHYEEKYDELAGI